MKYVVTLGGKERVVELVGGAGSQVTAFIDGEPHAVDALNLPNGSVSLIIDGNSYDVDFERPAGTDALDPNLNLRVRGEVFSLQVMEERRKRLQEATARAGGAGGPAQITSPMPGKVVKILKAAGTPVKEGEGVVVVEAMKMENELRAPSAGVVAEIRVKEGQAVEMGAVLAVLGPA
ncbi:MAG: biotin/lipoyl-containing protein [Myxococcota bacterium]